MAVAYEVSTESHTGTTGSTSQASFTWNHISSGRAALVFVFSALNATHYVTSVTYGGTTMTAVPYDASTSSTEAGTCRAYFLDNIPTGTQAVVVNRTNNATIMYAVCYTVTAASACEVYNAGVMTQGGATSNTGASSSGSTSTAAAGVKSVNDGSPGTDSLRFMGQFYGGSVVLGAATGSAAGPSIDFGAYVIATFYESAAGQGARDVGSVSGTDDLAVVALAVRETPATNVVCTPTAASLTLTGVTPTVSAPASSQPTSASLTLTGATPTVSTTNHVTALPGLLALILTLATPTVAAYQTFTPAAAGLTFTMATPAVVAANNIIVLPGGASLTLTGATPTVVAPAISTPTAGSLTFTGATPSVNAPAASTPGEGVLVLTGAVPSVTAGSSSDTNPVPAAAALTLTSATPTVTVTAAVAVLPTAASLTLTPATPVVIVEVASVAGDVTITDAPLGTVDGSDAIAQLAAQSDGLLGSLTIGDVLVP